MPQSRIVLAQALLQDADQTDPSLRLVSHNRRADNRYTTKLGIHENVLDDQEEDSSPAMKPRTMPLETQSNDEEEDTVSGSATPSPSKVIRTLDGVVCPTLSWTQWKAALQLANIEVGPNLLQRTENGARGIGESFRALALNSTKYGF